MRKDRVLVVDDDETICELVRSLMEPVYEIGVTLSGKDAVRRATEFIPDLILLDLLLPKMSGYDVCSRIMRDNMTRHIPVLVVSTLDTKDSMNKLRMAGARHFMKKPYDLDALLAKIKTLLPKSN